MSFAACSPVQAINALPIRCHVVFASNALPSSICLAVPHPVVMYAGDFWYLNNKQSF